LQRQRHAFDRLARKQVSRVLGGKMNDHERIIPNIGNKARTEALRPECSKSARWEAEGRLGRFAHPQFISGFWTRWMTFVSQLRPDAISIGLRSPGGGRGVAAGAVGGPGCLPSWVTGFGGAWDAIGWRKRFCQPVVA
jgi:hypothetical protein